MSWDDTEDTLFEVVMNHEEQYSIWPADRDAPAGWTLIGMQACKKDCLEYIEGVWTDMRPLSLRRWMADQEGRPQQQLEDQDEDDDGLVDRLCSGEHPVEMVLRPERTAAALAGAIDRGFVHVRFGQTEAGTELGVRLDTDASDLSCGDFVASTGSVRLVGALSLDWTPVRCILNIDIASLAGEGHLERT